ASLFVYLIDVIYIVLYKVAGRPADDLFGAELFIGDNNAEYNEENDGVFVVEAVGDDSVVPVVAQDRIGQASYCREEIHFFKSSFTKNDDVNKCEQGGNI